MWVETDIPEVFINKLQIQTSIHIFINFAHYVANCASKSDSVGSQQEKNWRRGFDCNCVSNICTQENLYKMEDSQKREENTEEKRWVKRKKIKLDSKVK